jgi:hypothetical protein
VRAAKKIAAPVPTEQIECERLLAWARLTHFELTRFGVTVYPSIDRFLVLIPNGCYFGKDRRAAVIQAARLRRAGLLDGASDYFLSIPRKGFGGLYLEMKRKKGGKTSFEQEDFRHRMLLVGYDACIVSGWESARKAIERYMKP